MARDKIHNAVKNALIKDGWVITDDPLILLPDEDNIGIDLGAEKILLAEKNLEKIAVEIKSFTQPSLIYEFHRAYDNILIMKVHFLKRMNMRIIIVDTETETIESWIK